MKTIASNHSEWEKVRAQWVGSNPPVVLFNKSHSGSRLLAGLLQSAGIHMGANLNESLDSLPVLEWVEYLVGRHYPDYSPLWREGTEAAEEAASRACRAFAAHWGGRPVPGEHLWGWKLCETAYILPVVEAFFPGARYLHLIRDGRDVAFCDHTPPNTAFWRKVYFDTERIRTWGGSGLRRADYQRHPHRFNAQHWVNSVQTGRKYGAMAGPRYLEVRYEDLCGNFSPTAARIFEFLGGQVDPAVLERVHAGIRTDSIGKFRHRPRRHQRQVLSVTRTELLALGYLNSDPWRPGHPMLNTLGSIFRAGRRFLGRVLEVF